MNPESDGPAKLAETRRILINKVQLEKCKSNSISTGKYTILTFLPKFLYKQFRKYANIFFLTIGLLQQIPGISPAGRYVTLVPFLVKLAITALKEIVEDFKRHQEDRKINDSKVQVLNFKDKSWETISWKNICVGDLVMVVSDKFIPADLVLLASSEKESHCYIETLKHLDGESNLKLWVASRATRHIKEHHGLSEFEIEAERPNKSLYDFTGNITKKGEEALPIGPNEILLRGSKLWNTNWICGVAVNTGAESKLMMNSTKAPLKESTIEKVTNYQIIFLFLILVTISLISSGVNKIQFTNGDSHSSITTEDNSGNNFFLNFLTFFILYNNLIPISLLVSLEMLRIFQALFIKNDEAMHYVDKAVKVNTYAITKIVLDEGNNREDHKVYTKADSIFPWFSVILKYIPDISPIFWIVHFLVIPAPFLVILAITAFMLVCWFVGYLMVVMGGSVSTILTIFYKQLRKYPSLFLLTIGLLKQIPDISPTVWTLLPYLVILAPSLGILAITAFKEIKENLHLEDHELINLKVKCKTENTEADSNLMMNSTKRKSKQSTVEKAMNALNEGNNREDHKVFTKADTNIHKLISFFAWFSVLLHPMLLVKAIMEYIALKADSNADKSLQSENNTIPTDQLKFILTMNTLNKPDSVCIFLLIFLLDSGDPALQKPIIFPSEPESYPDWFFTIFSFLPMATQYIVQKGKSVFQTPCSSISDQSETVWQIPKLGKTLTSLFESLLEGLLHSLCYLNIISEVSAGNHLMVIIEAKLSIDIEKNPGPIHDRCFTAAQNFCENPSSKHIFVLKHYVSMFLKTSTDISKEFLCDEKVLIWLKVLKILEGDQFQDNKQLSDDILSIWEVWENALSEKEDSEQDDCCQCKCEFHRTSPGSPNMVEPMSHPAITAQVAVMSTPPTALSIQPAMPFQPA